MTEQNPFSLADKHILVTGASSGIGQQTAITASQLGASLHLVGRNTERLTATQQACDQPNLHELLSCDLATGEGMNNLKSWLQAKQQLDGVVHAAGLSPTVPLRALSAAKIREILQVNLEAGLQLAQLVTKKNLIPETGQSLVFISSVMASTGEAGKLLYGASKGGLEAAVKSIAIELAPKNIRANCVAPGVVQSPMSESSPYQQDQEALQAVRDAHPLGLGSPTDVANACAYLLSDAAQWVTGTSLSIDGGYKAK